VVGILRSAQQTHAHFHEQHRVAHVAPRHSTVSRIHLQAVILSVRMRLSESMNADDLGVLNSTQRTKNE